MTQTPPPIQQQPMPETSGKAVASLVCSIAGFMFCFFVGQIIGIVLGNSALTDIRASRGRLGGDGLAKAGIIVGWIGLGIDILIVLMIIVWCAFWGLLVGAAGAAGAGGVGGP